MTQQAADLWDTLAAHKTGGYPAGAHPDFRTFWAGVDDVHGALVDLVTQARHSIVISMYGYDDDQVHELLVTRAADPTYYVQINLDSSQAGGVHERILLNDLAALEGTSVAIGRSAHGAISHLKGMVIDGWITVGGSTNWSQSGEAKQDNELVIYADPYTAAERRTRFDVVHDSMLKQMAAAAAKAA